jgi:hypothetical protein
LIFILFIIILLSWIIYKIGMPFQFHPSSLFSSIKFDHCSFDCYFFVRNHFLNWFCFTISPSFVFFLSNNLIFILLIVNFFALTSFLNWFVIKFLIENEFRILRVASFKYLTRFMMFSRFAWFFIFLCLS